MGKIIIILIILGIIIVSGYYFLFKNNTPKDEDKIIENKIINEDKTIMSQLILTSSAFEHMGRIPVKYTCDGQSLIPPLEISGVDEKAESLVLIMEDPDAPVGVYDHWLKFNLPVSLREIKEGTDPGGVSGLNTSNKLKYIGPCPPDREHRYFFKLYSLDTILDLQQGATKSQIELAMSGHILQQAVLIGLYERK